MYAGYIHSTKRISRPHILPKIGKDSKLFSPIQPFSKRGGHENRDRQSAPRPQGREVEKQFPAFYRFVLEHWFTLLRHSDYTIEYHVRPFSVEESRNIFVTNPKNLSLEEMFRLALTHTPGSETYNKIFMTAVQLFPDNPVANLNAACISLMQRDVKSAGHYLEKAPEVPETALAKGVLYLLKNQYEEAESFFRQAKAAGLSQADDNLKRILELK